MEQDTGIAAPVRLGDDRVEVGEWSAGLGEVIAAGMEIRGLLRQGRTDDARHALQARPAEAQAAVPQTRFLKDLVGTMEPDVAATKIARGIRRHKPVIIPGVRANLMAGTARHFPELFARSSELLLRWKFR